MVIWKKSIYMCMFDWGNCITRDRLTCQTRSISLHRIKTCSVLRSIAFVGGYLYAVCTVLSELHFRPTCTKFNVIKTSSSVYYLAYYECSPKQELKIWNVNNVSMTSSFYSYISYKCYCKQYLQNLYKSVCNPHKGSSKHVKSHLCIMHVFYSKIMPSNKC